MTAGFGWIGEINNQFNITKGATFAAVASENIPPNITFGPTAQCDNARRTPAGARSGSWFQSINRKLGIAVVNNWLWTKGRNTFNMGVEFRRAYQDDNEEQTEGGHFNFSQRTNLGSRIQAIRTLAITATHSPASFWVFRIRRIGVIPRNWNCATGISRLMCRTTSS